MLLTLDICIWTDCRHSGEVVHTLSEDPGSNPNCVFSVWTLHASTNSQMPFGCSCMSSFDHLVGVFGVPPSGCCRIQERLQHPDEPEQQ